uniref:Uncharacterized protein n=1 Tax=Lepeophtheirus salmonis TaxID=72036 RepID=A0A0K2T9Y9_LEPSM
MLSFTWLERGCNFFMKAVTVLYISCTKIPLRWSLTFSSYMIAVTSTANPRYATQSSSESSWMSCPFFPYKS